MKRRCREDPLHTSVNDTITRLSNLRNTCGHKFAIEAEVTTGSDFVCLDISKLVEVRITDLLLLLSEVTHMVSCVCDFGDQVLRFRFEAANKRAHVAKSPDVPDDDDVISKEVINLAPLTVDEAVDDVRLIARYIITVKQHMPLLHSGGTMRFHISSSPGIITITVKNLTCIDARLFEKLEAVAHAQELDDIVIFLSPADSQCIRISMNKSKRTVNV